MTATTAMPDQVRSTNRALSLLGALRWRCIGPPRGGRVVAVAGDSSNAAVFYFGACAGGVWKTYDGGTYWENVSDGFFKTASVGALAVAQSDPNVIYAGMGESCIRGDVSYGDGVYKSTDGGKTWVHLGLEDTRHIARIRIHPTDPDLVYVAALGHAFGPNELRGVIRSKDGGQSWEKVLFRNENAGAIDLTMDPNNPRILFAAIWEARRTPWSMESGGPGSGIFRSVDGGDTWSEITNNPGLPRGTKGRIGVAVSPARSGRVWATIEADDTGLFRSDDVGETWERVNNSGDIQGRPWYYQHVFADPQDPDTVWVLNYQAWKSVDGGRTFSQVTTPHGDNHDLWIDPRDSDRMIEGNDGGASVSFNGGESWSTSNNQLTAQFYHVVVDNQFPYRVYGTQQDNSAISVPSRTNKGAIPWEDCYEAGGSECGYITVHPEDPNIVISGAPTVQGGNLLRYDHSTEQVRLISVWPEIYVGWGAKDMKYRFQWTYPIMFSRHDPSVLFVTGNLVFRSSDQGSSWEAISPDLTRNDVTKLEVSGGPIVVETWGGEIYGTIFAFAESPLDRDVFWAGSDDGLVHVSRNGGRSWENITPTDLPEWALISMIEASPHDPGTAYMAATQYKLDDDRPMLYKTDDYGSTWTDISDGISHDDYTRVIREDPGRRGLLYAGTETGVYVSLDDGATWQSMQANLPTVPVYDMVVKDDDLVAATHGRSFWILDDLTQIRQITDGIADEPMHLMKPRATLRLPSAFDSRNASAGKNYRMALGANVTFVDTKEPDGEVTRRLLDAGQNPPEGVVVTYYLREKPEDHVTLSFSDATGNVVKTFSSEIPEGQSDSNTPGPRVGAGPGMNRFVWNMRYPDATGVPGDKTTEGMLSGALARPGMYQVTVTAGGQSQTESFEIIKDPRVSATPADFEAQFQLLLKVRDRLSETHDAVNRLRSIRQQVEAWVERSAAYSMAATISDAATSLTESLSAIESELIAIGQPEAVFHGDFPVKLNRKLAELTRIVACADFAPPKQAYEVYDDLSEKIGQNLQRLDEVIEEDVSRFTSLISDLDIPAIVPPQPGV